MNKLNRLRAVCLAASVVALSATSAANMNKDDYRADKARISAEYKAARAACDSQRENAKDVCVQEAKARERVALAELEYGYTGKAEDRTKVQEAKAKSAYAVAKERCDDQAGNAKDVCVKEAKAVETKALADAKMSKEIGEARREATGDKIDADYSVAIEKCDALANDAKNACVAAAKSKFGRN